VRTKNRTLSQEDVADKIREKWKLRDIVHPGHRTLVRYVEELEKSGEIPPRAG